MVLDISVGDDNLFMGLSEAVSYPDTIMTCPG